MRDEPETRLSEAEAVALTGLREPVTPPQDLEPRIIATLEARNLLRNRGTRLPFPFRPLLAAAAAVLIFLSGRAVGQREIAAEGPAGASQFMLLLFEDDRYTAPRPGREMERVAEYGEWARGLAERGVAVSGDELLPEGVTVDGAGTASSVRPGVPETPVGRFAGYFIVDGEDMDEAIGIARETPHLRYGGRVAVVPLAGH